MPDVVAISATVLKHKLTNWYKAFRKDHPHRNLTELNDITVKMLGTAAQPKLKTKGAETYGLMLFLVDTLRANFGRLELGRELLEAGQCLIDLIAAFDGHGMQMPASSIQRCFDLALRHFSLTESIEELIVPKRHMLLHLIRDIPHHGNPRFCATWFDESLNKTLKRSCKNVSQATFDASVLGTMRATLKPTKYRNKLKRQRE